MSAEKEHVFRDFQVSAIHLPYPMEVRREINVALFATYEPIRHWLKVRKMRAPFIKLLVDFIDEATATDEYKDGRVGFFDGICSVLKPIAPSSARENAGDIRWVIDRVQSALARVAEKKGWRLPEFEAVLDEFAQKPWPIVHYFEKLQTKDRRSGATCLPWMSFRPGFTQIGVRVSSTGKADRDVEILSKNDPLWLEDDFPMAKSKIQSGNFLLLDKAGKILATVPIEKEALH